jgi:8-oxo-dGTP pyrophosphatase MutT (NUDIX family)
VTKTFDLASLRKRLLPVSAILEPGMPSSPKAAVAIIINPEYEDGSILFIRRTQRAGDPWSGQIAFPGGHKRPKDHNLQETATRETEEEIGINLNNHELLGAMEPTYARTRRMLVAPFVFQLKSHVNVRSNEEVAESFYIPLNDLTTIKTSKSEVYTQDGALNVDSYVYRRHVIWGLTFKIINMLLNKDIAL